MAATKDNSSLRGKSTTKTITNAAFEEMDVDAPQHNTHKRTTQPSASKANLKRTKSGLAISLFQDRPKHEFWFGFPTMEQLAQDNGDTPPTNPATLADLISKGYTKEEAEEARHAHISFPRVPQKLWPSSRPDGIEGQHFNLTQLPFDADINHDTRFSLDYHVLLHFEKPKTQFTQ